MTTRFLTGDCRDQLRRIPTGSVQCVVTSPPYWGLRAYLDDDHPAMPDMIGLEKDPVDFIAHVVEVFREVHRVLRRDGTLWVNMGDSFTDGGRGDDVGSTLLGSRRNQRESRRSRVREGSRPFGLGMKQMLMMPARLAIAMQDDGWTLRSDIVWHKPNPMPESVRDRPTKAHEFVFLFSRARHYYYDAKAIAEPVSGTAHARGTKGYGPKAVGRVTKVPTGWATDTGRRHDEKDGRYHAERAARPQSRVRVRETKNNQSFLGSTNALVATRNKRDVWTIRPEAYKGKHSATFPAALVRPCLLASTSPRCCELCGAAWTPEYGPALRVDGERAGNKVRRMGEGTGIHRSHQGRSVPWAPAASVIVGYAPRCHCEGATGTGRCVVLDPFGGAGTTAIVADELGLDSIMIDLNPQSTDEATARVDRERQRRAEPPKPARRRRPAVELEDEEAQLPLEVVNG